jgi:hypothetical protein
MTMSYQIRPSTRDTHAPLTGGATGQHFAVVDRLPELRRWADTAYPVHPLAISVDRNTQHAMFRNLIAATETIPRLRQQPLGAPRGLPQDDRKRLLRELQLGPLPIETPLRDAGKAIYGWGLGPHYADPTIDFLMKFSGGLSSPDPMRRAAASTALALQAYPMITSLSASLAGILGLASLPIAMHGPLCRALTKAMDDGSHLGVVLPDEEYEPFRATFETFYESAIRWAAGIATLAD